jgi:1,4-dihydroxy-2-naphthoate octaprenyltransferase
MSGGEYKFGGILMGLVLIGGFIYANSGAVMNALGIIAVIAAVVIGAIVFFLKQSNKGIYK